MIKNRQLTIAGQHSLSVRSGERRLGHVPVEIRRASEAMRVLDRANSLDMIPSDVVFQLPPENLGIVKP